MTNQDPDLPKLLAEKMREIDAEISMHERKLLDLRRLKSAYVVISNSVDPAAPAPSLAESLVAYGIVTSPIDENKVDEADIFPLSHEEELSYGDMTRSMRKFVVQGKANMRTRSEVVEFSKRMNTSANFPYRFLKRMQDSGELREVSPALYVATPKMLRKVEG